MQFAVISPLDAPLGASWQDFLHFPPMFPVLEHVPANLDVLIESEILPGDAWPEVIKVPLPNLLGSKFYIVRKILGILELMSFHFSPSLLTSAITTSSSSLDQLRSFVHIEIRLYLL